MKDRTKEIKEIWESTPKFALEANLSGINKIVLSKAIECMSWVIDFQLKYKDEFAPFEGLGGIVDNPTNQKATYKNLKRGK